MTFHLSRKMSNEFINAGRQPFSGKSSGLDLPAVQKLLFLTGPSTTYVGCAACFPPVTDCAVPLKIVKKELSGVRPLVPRCFQQCVMLLFPTRELFVYSNNLKNAELLK